MPQDVIRPENVILQSAQRNKLLAMTWEDFIALPPSLRSRVALTGGQKQVPGYARIKPLVLARMAKEYPDRFGAYKGRTSVTVTLPIDNEDRITYEIGQEWVELPLQQLLQLWIRVREDVMLGQAFSIMREIGDGHGGKQWVAQQQPGYPDLFEFGLTPDVKPVLELATA